nr:helicase [Tanacetum cinerariifolium]
SAFFAGSDILCSQSLGKYEFRSSLSNIFHTSVMIHSNTIIRRDETVQSFYGLKLSDIDQDIGDGEDGTIMGSLIKMLDQNSTIAKAFRMEKDWCHSHTSVNVDLRMLSERTNSRQYNAPTVAEVAALFTNNFRDGKPTRDIVVNKKDSGPKRISELHPSYMAFKYPLLFSYGEDGYQD